MMNSDGLLDKVLVKHCLKNVRRVSDALHRYEVPDFYTVEFC